MMTQNNRIWTILELIKWSTQYFQKWGIEQPRLTTEILLAHALKQNRIDLYIHHDQPLAAEELACFKKFLQRRILHEPVAYITEKKEFWSLDFMVTPDVLIPRPETEMLVENALSIIDQFSEKRPMRIIDLGVGSGAIIVALATERSGHSYFGTDVSVRAVNIAAQNAKGHGVGHLIRFYSGDWLDAIKPTKSFDMILSNAPYIATADIATLPDEIKNYEPYHALNGGETGIEAILKILNQATVHLAPGGYILLEIGYNQKEMLLNKLSAASPFMNIRFLKDFAGLNRLMCLQKQS